jgi:undecaprenyl-diphosphatase
MQIVAAFVLGIIQGLTEFLPISSSAHLILVPWILGWNPEGLIFDVSLHVGTAVAILAYFWRDWVTIAKEATQGILKAEPFANVHRRLAWLLVLGTLPALVLGLLFEKRVEQYLRSPLISIFTLTGFGLLLLYAEQKGRRTRTIDQFGMSDSLWIGTAQALALVPGVSRSGITISTALLRDSDRTSAARFSFLLSTPVIVGAGILEGWRLIQALRAPALDTTYSAGSSWVVIGVGFATAASTGFFCIRYFLRYIQNHSFIPFVVYRFILALVVLAFYMCHSG